MIHPLKRLVFFFHWTSPFYNAGRNVRQKYEVDSPGGGFKRFVFQFSPLKIGEDSHFDGHIFQLGWFNHQPVIVGDTHIPPFHLNWQDFNHQLMGWFNHHLVHIFFDSPLKLGKIPILTNIFQLGWNLIHPDSIHWSTALPRSAKAVAFDWWTCCSQTCRRSSFCGKGNLEEAKEIHGNPPKTSWPFRFMKNRILYTWFTQIYHSV